MKTESTVIDGKKVTVYICDQAEAPVVYSNDFEDDTAACLTACREIGCPKFHLVSITGLRWDEELSPWPAGQVVSKEDHFTGEADAYLTILEEKILPYVQSLLPESRTNILMGYSMGGLFALYAAHHSREFDAYAAPSASVWYPDFLEYAEKTGFEKKPACIYLSLGDRESRTKHPYLSQTEPNMEKLYEIYTSKNIASVFEKNPGNHFKNIPMRTAKGINWVLQTLEQ